MGVVIKKTKKEIQEMIDIIQNVLDTLPECNIFEDDNQEAKKECQLQIKELKMALKGQLPSSDSEVFTWLIGSWSTLNDYLS